MCLTGRRGSIEAKTGRQSALIVFPHVQARAHTCMMCVNVQKQPPRPDATAHTACYSSSREQPVGFITVSTPWSSAKTYRFAELSMGFFADIRQLMKNTHKPSSLKLTCTEKQTYVLRKMMDKQTDGVRNMSKQRGKICLCVLYVYGSNLYS